MAIAEDRLFEMRTKQLAVVHLTRRKDVKVTQEPSDFAVDLTVSLFEDGHNVGRLLAVEVKVVEPGKQLQTVRFTSKQEALFHSFRLPLCLFAFSMDDDRGYWRWIRRPVSNSSEKRRLTTQQDTVLHSLTTDAIGQMLDDVRDWYDA